MTTPIYSLSICGQMTLNLHSLNNEGGEGNQTQTRMVEIVEADGKLHSVNAISGDMFKHIQAEHLQRIGLGNGLTMSQACRELNANRISADDDFREFIKKDPAPTPVQTVDYMVKHCAVTSMEGILITEGKQSTPRKSLVEFGWVVGLPGTRTEQYFHAKYVPDSREKPQDEDKRQGNLGQSIFHRPASSGRYAAIVNVELARIGYNDISQKYVEGMDDDERLKRHQSLLQSLMATFIQPNGAMRNTQMPHVVDFKGVISYTTAILPAPSVSPLNEKYDEQCEQIAEAFKMFGEKAVVVKRFNSMAKFASEMQTLIKTTSPYRLQIAQEG